MTSSPAPPRPAGGKRLALSVGEACRAARRRLGLTQEEVAERVKLATEVYGRLERGNNLPSVPTLRRICLVLQVSADELLALGTGEVLDTPPPSPGGAPATEPPLELRRLFRRAGGLTKDHVRVLNVLAVALQRRR